MSAPTTVLTIGVFDGFHRGHAAVLAAARAAADRCRARLTVLTFGTHPRVVLAAGDAPPLLTLTDEKVRLMRGAGADEVRVLDFTPSLAARGPRRFLADYVYPFHRLAALVVGYDFAMGRDRAGSAGVLERIGLGHGFTVARVPGLPAGPGEGPVSSTRIREALREGDVEEGARLLGRPYALTGTVGGGAGRGRTLGFPTANLEVSPRKLRPGRGVYVVRVRGAGEEARPAVVNLGRRPTFDGDTETVEAHLLDFRGDLRGRPLRLEFLRRLRGEVKFNGPKELADQIARDVADARRLLDA